MALAAFDTLKVSKDLQQAGIQESHAEAIALAVKQGQGDLATKQDIALLKSEIGHLRTELKTDIGRLRTELKTDIGRLRTELKTDIGRSRTEIKSDNVWLKWASGVNFALTFGIFVAVISGTITLTLAP